MPAIPLAGPDVAVLTDWVTEFAADEGKDVALLTRHYYRESQNPASTIDKLLSVDPNLQPMLHQMRAASQSCGAPYRICEANSFSGGGKPGVSDTLASALWVLDYMFTLAACGCSGINISSDTNVSGVFKVELSGARPFLNRNRMTCINGRRVQKHRRPMSWTWAIRPQQTRYWLEFTVWK